MRMNAEMQVRSQQSTSSPKLQGFPGAGFNFSTLPLSYPPGGSSVHLVCPGPGYLGEFAGPARPPGPSQATTSNSRPAPRAGPAPAPPPGHSARTPRSCPRLRLTQPTQWPIRIILPTRYGLRRGPRVSHLQPRAGARRLTRSLAAGEGTAAPEGGGAARAPAWRRRCELRAACLRCAACRRVSAGRGRGSRGSPGLAGIRA